MTVSELNADEMTMLKQNYLTERLIEVEGRTPSWGELADADDIVGDQLIFEAYADFEFSKDDFFGQ